MKKSKWTKSFLSRVCTFAVTTAVLVSSIAITSFATVSSDVAINGKSIVLSPTPDEGYIYVGCTVNWVDECGNTQTTELSAEELCFYMPTEDITITPKFVLNTDVTIIDTGSAVG